MDARSSSLPWIVTSNWTASCSAKRAEALSSAAAAVKSRASMEEHAVWRSRGNFSLRSGTICSPANGPLPQAHPLLQGLKVSLMKGAWPMCCQAQHLSHAPVQHMGCMAAQTNHRLLLRLPPAQPPPASLLPRSIQTDATQPLCSGLL